MKKLLLTAILILSSASMVSANAEDDFNGHYYELIDGDGIDWASAHDYCVEHGGHLATITSAAEQRFIEKLLRQGTKDFYWLDSMFTNDGYGWGWITNEDFNYENWSLEYTRRHLGEGKYFGLICRTGEFGSWDAAVYNDNIKKCGFICEWDE